MEPIIRCVQKFKSVINHRFFFANLDDYSVTKTDMRNFFVERLEGIKTGMRCQKTLGTRTRTHFINKIQGFKYYKTMDSTLLTKENLLFGTRLGAMALSGLWYGASQYITSVECPAR